MEHRRIWREVAARCELVCLPWPVHDRRRGRRREGVRADLQGAVDDSVGRIQLEPGEMGLPAGRAPPGGAQGW